MGHKLVTKLSTERMTTRQFASKIYMICKIYNNKKKQKREAGKHLARCGRLCNAPPDGFSVGLVLIGQCGIQQVPKRCLGAPTYIWIDHKIPIRLHFKIWETKQVYTKLFIDNSHVRNSFITVIVSFAIEFFRAHINRRHLQSGLPWYFWIYLGIGHRINWRFWFFERKVAYV